MKDKNTIEIGVKATGFEEAAEQIELMADAMSEFPATVNIKAKDCSVHVHTTNIIERTEPETSWAKGGVRRDADHTEEWDPEEDEVVMPKDAVQEMIMMDILRQVRQMCREIDCAGCPMRDPEMPPADDCKLSDLPSNWDI